jgi:HAD superfamily hydrolase (TIGR01484 family)
MRYASLASDYDGTLASEGVVFPRTLAALERLKASGRKLILATGRDLDDLLKVFPEHALFDRVVADNGAVLYSPATRETRVLAEAPSREFVDTLRQRHVEPLTVGQVIVATVEPHDVTVLTVIRELGLELQVIYNRGSVMVLPSGINKSTGLAEALSELRLSSENVVGIGDGENDHSLLKACALGVAVANAISSLKTEADWTTTQEDGKGVEELIDRLLFNDLADIEPRRSIAKTGDSIHKR